MSSGAAECAVGEGCVPAIPLGINETEALAVSILVLVSSGPSA